MSLFFGSTARPRAVAAVGLVLLAVRRDLQVAVVVQARPDRAVVGGRDAVREQGVHARVVAVAPAAVVEFARGGLVLTVESAVVPDRERDAARPVRDPDSVLLVGVGRGADRWRPVRGHSGNPSSRNMHVLPAK